MAQPFPSRPAVSDERCSSTGRRPTARLSHHARIRCREMGLGTKAVKAVVAAPEIDLPAGGGLRSLVAGVLAVIYDAGTNEVVTSCGRRARAGRAGRSDRPPADSTAAVTAAAYL
ncbi:MAG: hypothetical protein ACRDZ3_05025 [Acidimicrobiia bacterium]